MLYFIEITFPSKSAQLSYDIQTFIFNMFLIFQSTIQVLLFLAIILFWNTPSLLPSCLPTGFLLCVSRSYRVGVQIRKLHRRLCAEVVNSDHVICPSGGQKQTPWNQRTQ